MSQEISLAPLVSDRMLCISIVYNINSRIVRDDGTENRVKGQDDLVL
jgi:hypothetical protein